MIMKICALVKVSVFQSFFIVNLSYFGTLKSNFRNTKQIIFTVIGLN